MIYFFRTNAVWEGNEVALMNRKLRCLLCCGTALFGLMLAACSPSQSVEGIPDETAAPTAAAAPESEPQQEPVVFRSGVSVLSDETALTLRIDADELVLLDAFPALASVDFTDSACYPEITAWALAHPDVTVRYTVPLGDQTIANDATDAVVSAVADVSALACLPSLESLTVTEPVTAEAVTALRETRPDLRLSYTVAVGDLTIPCDAAEADATALSSAFADALVEAIPVLPQLQRIKLSPDAGWTLDQADALQQAREGLLVDYPVSVFGVTFSLADEVVSFNGISLTNRVEKVRALLPYLRNVKRLDMENCEIPDATMAQLRSEFPNPKIVWRVQVGSYSCRTDSIMIRFSVNFDPRRLHDSDVGALKYCNEVRYLDLGHNLLTKMDFLRYMPDIEVLIIAVGPITSIEGVETCKKLEYCEFLSGGVTDLTPLAACTELRHLNLSYNLITDITPLYGLTKLERLWISRNDIPKKQIEEIRRLLPDCEINTTAQNPTGEGWRSVVTKRFEVIYHPRYKLLRQQFCYDLGIFSYNEETRPVFDD